MRTPLQMNSNVRGQLLAETLVLGFLLGLTSVCVFDRRPAKSHSPSLPPYFSFSPHLCQYTTPPHLRRLAERVGLRYRTRCTRQSQQAADFQCCCCAALNTTHIPAHCNALHTAHDLTAGAALELLSCLRLHPTHCSPLLGTFCCWPAVPPPPPPPPPCLSTMHTPSQAGLSRSRLANNRMCNGPTPQQPPMMPAPAAAQPSACLRYASGVIVPSAS